MQLFGVVNHRVETISRYANALPKSARIGFSKLMGELMSDIDKLIRAVEEARAELERVKAELNAAREALNATQKVRKKGNSKKKAKKA